MSSALRLAGMAIVALIAGVTEPSQSPASSLDISGEYDWRMLDREQYAMLDPALSESGRPVSGRLFITRSQTGYDAQMACNNAREARSFLVVVADDRVVVYAAMELGELRFDVPRTEGVDAEWTLRTPDGRSRTGRLEITRSDHSGGGRG